MSAAARQRLHRQRQAEGRRVLRGGFAVSAETVAVFERFGVIDPTHSDAELIAELEDLLDLIAEQIEARNAVTGAMLADGK